MSGTVGLAQGSVWTHVVHQQLLAGLPDAAQRHVHVLLARQAVDAAVEGVGHGLGHLETTGGGYIYLDIFALQKAIFSLDILRIM